MGLLCTATRPIDTYTNIIKGTPKIFKGLLINKKNWDSFKTILDTV